MEIWKIILIVCAALVGFILLLWAYLAWSYRQKVKALVRFGARAILVIVDMNYGARMVLYYTLFRQRGYISSANLDTLFSCGIPFNFGRANEEHYGFEHDVSSSGLLKVGNEDEINVLKDAFLVAHGMKNNICGYEWKWDDGSPIEDERAMASRIMSDIAHNLISIKLEGEEDGR